jgi:predicted phosphoadenosine phosphosulfate sulfurtransferase
MRRYNRTKNVYDAAMERYKFIFDNFPRIYLSFSGARTRE